MAAVSVKRCTALTSFPGRKRENSGNEIAVWYFELGYLWILRCLTDIVRKKKNTKETQSPRLVCFLQLMPKLRGVKLIKGWETKNLTNIKLWVFFREEDW